MLSVQCVKLCYEACIWYIQVPLKSQCAKFCYEACIVWSYVMNHKFFSSSVDSEYHFLWPWPILKVREKVGGGGGGGTRTFLSFNTAFQANRVLAFPVIYIKHQVAYLLIPCYFVFISVQYPTHDYQRAVSHSWLSVCSIPLMTISVQYPTHDYQCAVSHSWLSACSIPLMTYQCAVSHSWLSVCSIPLMTISVVWL